MEKLTSPELTCPKCQATCQFGCWGDGLHNCQQFNKINCSAQCDGGRCYGPNPHECCHFSCVGGCTGPTNRDCLACHNYDDEGICKYDCPPSQIYNQTTFMWELNPDGKYAYGSTCVRNCPKDFFIENGACVRTCSGDRIPKNGECKSVCPTDAISKQNQCSPCDDSCEITCQGTDLVDMHNLDSFRNCTKLEGDLNINGFATFGLANSNHIIHPDQLEVFSTLQEITGSLSISGSDDSEFMRQLTNLSYFRNLRRIHGKPEHPTLFVGGIETLTSLELSSLKTIDSGYILIYNNPNLCFVNTIDWTKLSPNASVEIMIENNRNSTECSKCDYIK